MSQKVCEKVFPLIDMLNYKWSWAPVAHACNPSYLGGRDQEDHGLKPAQANNSQDLI
jgi:hypothetical protein